MHYLNCNWMWNGQGYLLDDMHWYMLRYLRVCSWRVVMLMIISRAAASTTSSIPAIVSFPAVLRGVAKRQCADYKLIGVGKALTRHARIPSDCTHK